MKRNYDKGYLERLQSKYTKARKLERIIILDEFTKTIGREGRYAGILLHENQHYKAKAIKRPRNKTYRILDVVILAKVYMYV